MDNPLRAQYSAEIRYLLHRMEPDEREQFGQRVVEDQETFDRVAEAETELFDAHVRGTLPAELREDFARHLLQTPRQLRRLSSSRALAQRSRGTRVSSVAMLALAAGVLLGVAIAPRLWRDGRSEAAVLRLSINQTRASASVPEFRVAEGKPVDVRIPWNPAEPGKLFRVELQRQRTKVWAGVVAPAGGELVFRLEPGVLQPGVHELTVESAGGEPVGFAEFKVTSQ